MPARAGWTLLIPATDSSSALTVNQYLLPRFDELANDLLG
jgi:hypothetical protein